MNLPSYQTKAYADNYFQFYSRGEKTYNLLMGITKIPNRENDYNLGFGVWDRDKNTLDDKISIRNGDRDKILGTVGKKALKYMDKHPEIRIFATGSVQKKEDSDEFEMRVRTRLYQMGISQNYEELNEKYIIEAFVATKDKDGNFIGDWPDWKGEWVPFKKGTNYDAFSLTLRR